MLPSNSVSGTRKFLVRKQSTVSNELSLPHSTMIYLALARLGVAYPRGLVRPLPFDV
jgi:hypothetical protein